MQRILITGGAGFIGVNLADHFLPSAKVVVLDNLSRPGVKKNLEWLQQHSQANNLEFLLEDVRDQAALDAAVKGVDLIFHEAGQTAVTTSLTNPTHDFEVNALGTFNLLEAIRRHNPEAILVYASTNKVYGQLEALELKESDSRYTPTQMKAVPETWPLDFHSPYGCSKGAADQYVRDYARSFGLRTVVFRQSCMYGVHQMGVEDQGWLAHFASQALQDKKITLYGDGKQVRDVLYIADLVQAYAQAVEAITTTSGQVYNLGGGESLTISLLELIDLLENKLGKTVKIEHQPTRVGDQKYYVSDVAKAKQDFNWEPTTAIDQGVDALLSWLKLFHHLS